MCRICANGFSDLNFNQAVIDKNQIFKKLPQISHIHKHSNEIKTNCFFPVKIL